MRLVLAACLLAGLATRVSADAKSEKARADKLFDDGRRYLANKEYALACTAFEQSQGSDPAIGTQLNIALCYEQWGHFASAYHAYLEAERLAKLKFDDRAKHAQKKIDELQPKIPRLRIDIPDDADASAVFLLDGKEIERSAFADDLLLDIGEHVVEARVPGKPPKISKLTLENGQRKTLKIDVPKVETFVAATPRKAGRFYGGIALMSGGAIAIGVASYVSLLARSDYNNAILDCANKLCETSDSYRITQDARRKANYMSFVGGAGAVFAVVGLYLIVTSHGDPPKREKVSAGPVVTPGMIGIALGGPL